MKTMKAMRIHGPEQLRLDEVPVPQPQYGEVLVQVKAAGICGSDLELYFNESAHIKDGRTKLPIITGHEWSGVVAQLGEGVTGFSVGDKVTGECNIFCGECEMCRQGHFNLCEDLKEVGIFKHDGAFAEYVCVPAKILYRFDKLSFEEAALIEPMTVSYYSALCTDPKPSDTILVVGPGPIGLQTVQILKNVFGVKRVILAGTRPQRLKLGLELGADAVINVREENLFDRVRELTHGRMLDKVVEASGGSDVFDQFVGAIRPRGKIVLAGLFGNKTAHMDWDKIVLNELSMVGANGSPFNWNDAIERAESGQIEMQKLISHVLPLEELDQAIRLIVNKNENVCKVVVKP